MRLLTFPIVLITSHQAFFTANALEEIARVTMANLTAFDRGEATANEVGTEKHEIRSAKSETNSKHQ